MILWGYIGDIFSIYIYISSSFIPHGDITAYSLGLLKVAPIPGSASSCGHQTNISNSQTVSLLESKSPILMTS